MAFNFKNLSFMDVPQKAITFEDIKEREFDIRKLF